MSVFLTIFALILSTLNLSTSWQTRQQESLDKRILELMDGLEIVAHHHAVERGLTAGYLGAPNEDKQQALRAQRAKADQAVDTLQQMVRQPWPAELQITHHLSLLEQTLSNKSETRLQVDNQSAPSAFAFYSTVNKVALDILQTLRMYIVDTQVQKNLSAIIYFAWFKERAGQLRGKINGLLARGTMADVAKAEVAGFISDSTLINQYLNRVLEDQSLEQFQQILLNPNSRAINQVHQAIITAQPGLLTSEDFPASAVWFAMSTTQIAEIKSLLDDRWLQLHEQISATVSAATLRFWIEVALLAGLLMFIAVINVHLVNSLRHKLAHLTRSLRKVAEEGDLTEDIRLESQDELGRISNAVQSTIYAFKVLIMGLAESINSSTRLGNQLNAVSKQVLSDANSTQQLATSIATSVEQMAATSDEIARSAASALDASDLLNKNAERTSGVNLHSRNAMLQLNEHMQQVENKAGLMEQQVSTISGILDTIKNLAEQTNLLALNAAIEAARAGESGRGFAVVADQVRNLAKSSKDSSDRISDLLKALQRASTDVVSAIKNNVSSTHETLLQVSEAQQISVELKTQASRVESLSHQVATAAEQQSTVAREMASDANKVLAAATNELQTAEKMLNIFEELKINNDVLESTMANFKIH